MAHNLKKTVFKFSEKSKKISVPIPIKSVVRPKLAREIKAEKEKEKRQIKSVITVANISKQTIIIHLDPPPGVDFYIGAEDKHLRPGRSYPFPKYRVRMQQLIRLQKKGFLSIISDSDKNQEESTQKVVVLKK